MTEAAAAGVGAMDGDQAAGPACAGRALLFGSEVKVILEVLVLSRWMRESRATMQPWALAPPDRTMLGGIEKLRPGEVMVFDLAHPERGEAGSSIRAGAVAGAGADRTGAGSGARVAPVAGRCREAPVAADVPVGGFLSGGVDSSIVVSSTRPHVRDLKTFSVRFDHPDDDESPWSRQMADRLGTDHYELPFGAEDVRALVAGACPRTMTSPDRVLDVPRTRCRRWRAGM